LGEKPTQHTPASLFSSFSHPTNPPLLKQLALFICPHLPYDSYHNPLFYIHPRPLCLICFLSSDTTSPSPSTGAGGFFSFRRQVSFLLVPPPKTLYHAPPQTPIFIAFLSHLKELPFCCHTSFDTLFPPLPLVLGFYNGFFFSPLAFPVNCSIFSRSSLM